MKRIKKTPKRFRLSDGTIGPGWHGARLRDVYHVSHMDTALRILADGQVATRRVDDDSCLDTHRVSVAWAAPNRWPTKGSRYGTIEFAFDFAELMDGRRMYWVETVDDRKPDTCRMLITDRDVGDLPVTYYDPEKSRGPIRLVDGEWFWREDVVVELMVQAELPMSRCSGVDIVPHSREYCGKGSAYRCKEVGACEIAAAARLVAGALAGRYRLPRRSLSDGGRLSRLVQTGWSGIVDALDAGFDDLDGSLRAKPDVDTVVAASLMHLADGRADPASDAAALVSSARRVRASLARLLRRRTGIEVVDAHAKSIALADPVAEGRKLPARRPRGRSSADGRVGAASGSRDASRWRAG